MAGPCSKCGEWVDDEYNFNAPDFGADGETKDPKRLCVCCYVQATVDQEELDAISARLQSRQAQ